jgi:anaerobic ribonucleoside-triphosphate reductase activating protein
MTIRLAKKHLEKESIVDGEGLRAVIWTQGCSHNCLGCHNPKTHDFNKGFLIDIDVIKKEIDILKLHDGLTFSGGDPFFQIKECTEIAMYAKNKGLNIWCYTGFTYEQLMNIKLAKEFLNYIDVLIDGKFEISKKTFNAKFRGSSNQRLIDVPKSLKKGKVVLLKEEKKTNLTYEKVYI